MGGYKEHPRYNIISIRLTDEERKEICIACATTNKTISGLMREALSYIKTSLPLNDPN